MIRGAKPGDRVRLGPGRRGTVTHVIRRRGRRVWIWVKMDTGGDTYVKACDVIREGVQ